MKSRFLIVAICAVFGGCATHQQQGGGTSAQYTEQQGTELYALHHRILPDWLFNSNGLLFVSLLNDDIDRLRESIAEIAGPEYAAGVTSKVSADKRVVYITFPKPLRVPICYHVALLKTPEGYRYLTLERTEDPLSLGDVTFLCEWTPDMTHLNYGPRRYRSLDKFEAEVAALLADPSRRTVEAATEFD
jgi:hypothetical protein